MASVVPLTTQTLTAPVRGEPISRAPLFIVALALTTGVVADHFTPIPIVFALLLAGLALLLGLAALTSRSLGLPLIYLLIACSGLGASWHHYRCRLLAHDDYSLRLQPGPQLYRLRGRVEEDFTKTPAEDAVWRGPLGGDSWYSTLRVEAIETPDGWQEASGRARVLVSRSQPEVVQSDTVELRGRLKPLPVPTNPGERDRERELLDQGITGSIAVSSPDEITRLEPGYPGTARGWLAQLRRDGLATLSEHLAEPEAGLARALVLGDTRALDRAGWQKYTRTGVVHVLVISGQHLVLLAWFAQLLLDLLRVRHRPAAIAIAVAMWFYVLLVGLEPPVLRSVVMVSAICAGRLVSRTATTGNSFALGWIVLLAWQPDDIFRLGCQFSYLAVAVLFWGVPRWLPQLEPTDPLDILVEQTRPLWQRALRRGGRLLLYTYLLNTAVTVALWPLLLAQTGQVPWPGLFIGPPVMLLATLALIAGFFTLLFAALCPPLAGVPAWLLGLSLQGCEVVVDFAALAPGARLVLPLFPAWWAWAFYAVFLGGLWLPHIKRRAPAYVLAGVGWLVFGFVYATVPWPRDECRVTFLDVGKGCCTVIETPDGRVIVYDAGSMFQPSVGRQVIIPYLRARGINRIDELVLSHADLDHFNAVRDLLDEIAVGQVTCSPTFLHKQMPQVGLFEKLLEKKGVPLRTVSAGDRLLAGDVVLEVVHPPADGPDGVENVRSVVLRLRHGEYTMLLTGDLEGPGLDRVLAESGERVDVLMAPHHGSIRNNPERMATTFRPALVVSSQGPREEGQPEPYTKHGARYLTTDQEGAVTVRSHASGLVVETFKTREQFTVQSPGGRVK